MDVYELTIISRFHGEEEQISVIPVARMKVLNGVTELIYGYQGDIVKLCYDNNKLSMKRTGKVNFTLTVAKNGRGALRLDEGGVGGETPLVTDGYQAQDGCVSFEYHYESMGDDKSQRENIKLILKKSEEK